MNKKKRDLVRLIKKIIDKDNKKRPYTR